MFKLAARLFCFARCNAVGSFFVEQAGLTGRAALFGERPNDDQPACVTVENIQSVADFHLTGRVWSAARSALFCRR